MLIKYKTKDEVDFELINSIINKKILFNIYKYNKGEDNCDKYFEISDNYEYVGYVENDCFYIVNLKNNLIDENFKKKFDFIEKYTIKLLVSDWKIEDIEERIEFTNNQRLIFNKFSKIDNFKYIELKCKELIDLKKAKTKINELNHALKCIDYKINIDYVFQMEEITEMHTLSEIKSTMLLLCIIHENKCISSLILKHNIDEDTKGYYLEFDSKTKEEYENQKLNKLLRAIIIIIAKKISSSIDYVLSVATNPTSSYLMIKYFNAVPKKKNLKLETYEDFKKYYKKYDEDGDGDGDGIVSVVELNVKNIKNAETVFKDTIKQICGKKSVSYLNKLRKMSFRKMSFRKGVINTIRRVRKLNFSKNTKKSKKDSKKTKKRSKTLFSPYNQSHIFSHHWTPSASPRRGEMDIKKSQ